MKAVLNVLGNTKRIVWLADSFHGFPAPDDKYPLDAGNELHNVFKSCMSEQFVEMLFHGYGLMDDRVCFLPGFFATTLFTAPIDSLALLRLDGDMYGSTMETLEALYDKVSIGGYIIIDDWASATRSGEATKDFRDRRRITTPMKTIDWAGAYWIKE